MSSHKPKRNKWIVLTGIPIQMGVIIYAFAWLGGWLDEKYANPDKVYTKVLVLAGVAIALYNLYRQVQELNKNDGPDA